MFGMLVLFVACKDWPPGAEVPITFRNNSEQDVYVYSPIMDYGVPDRIVYPDTSLVGHIPSIIEKIPANTWNNLTIILYKQIKEYWTPDTISFFVLNADSIDKYGWPFLKINDFVLLRYDMTLNDYNNISAITFPPSSEMRKITIVHEKHKNK